MTGCAVAELREKPPEMVTHSDQWNSSDAFFAACWAFAGMAAQEEKLELENCLQNT